MKHYKLQIRETPQGLAIDLSVRLSFEELSAILTADQIRELLLDLAKVANVEAILTADQIRELLLGLAKAANVKADPLPDGEPIENEKRGL